MNQQTRQTLLAFVPVWVLAGMVALVLTWSFGYRSLLHYLPAVLLLATYSGAVLCGGMLIWKGRKKGSWFRKTELVCGGLLLFTLFGGFGVLNLGLKYIGYRVVIRNETTKPIQVVADADGRCWNGTLEPNGSQTIHERYVLLQPDFAAPRRASVSFPSKFFRASWGKKLNVTLKQNGSEVLVE